MRLLTTVAGSAAVGGWVSIGTAIVRYGGKAWTAVLAACAFVSGEARLTFGAGDGGAGVTSDAIFTVSALSPVLMTSSSPAARPFVLASRTAVAPAAAAWLSVVLAATPRAVLPAASVAR